MKVTGGVFPKDGKFCPKKGMEGKKGPDSLMYFSEIEGEDETPCSF